MRTAPATAILLLATGSVAADDIYDAVFVSDPAACERAGEADFGQVLFDLQATVLIPRHGIWSGGELVCTMRNIETDLSPIADTPADIELYATARAMAMISISSTRWSCPVSPRVSMPPMAMTVSTIRPARRFSSTPCAQTCAHQTFLTTTNMPASIADATG